MDGRGLLRELAGRFYYWAQGWTAPKPHVLDVSLGLPQMALLASSFESRKFDVFEESFTRLAPDERFVALSALAQGDLSTDTLDEWGSQSSTSIAPLFKGSFLTYQAWEARGGARGAEVPEDAADEFISLLHQSWELLLTAYRMDESEPEPITRLIPVAMGLGVSRDTLDDIFNAYKATGVQHLGAAMYMIDAVSPKWLGSRDEVFAFARAHAASFPQHVSGIAHAHVENWVYENHIRGAKDAETYFQQEAVREEIRECWHREADFSLRTDYFRFAALNTYAFCFLMMLDDALLVEALKLIGDRCTSKPWSYVHDNPFWVLNTARTDQGLPPL